MTRAAQLRDASVLVVGAGALGCAAARTLASAGIGHLTLVDHDRVELSNLHRQLLHEEADIGRLKVDSARASLEARHPGAEITTVASRLTPDNAAALFGTHACVIDATDGLETKFMLNDEAVRLRRPLIHGGVVRLLGQLMTVRPYESACYRCLFGAPPNAADVPSCQEAGVLGPLAVTIGTLQAAEAIRLVTGRGTLLTDRLLTFDALRGRWRVVKLRRNQACRACGSCGAGAAALL
jgi:molybdopterin/thiamine biosynthesis adenylyltransferase